MVSPGPLVSSTNKTEFDILVVKDLFYTILCDIVCQRIISVAQASINVDRLNFLVNLVVQMGAIKFLIVN